MSIRNILMDAHSLRANRSPCMQMQRYIFHTFCETLEGLQAFRSVLLFLKCTFF